MSGIDDFAKRVGVVTPVVPVTQGGSSGVQNFASRVGEEVSSAGQEREVIETLKLAYDNIKDMTADEVVQYLKENQELPGGLGGAIAGGIIGFLSPMPGGAVLGSILGGAIGSGAGSISTDITMDRPVDYQKAGVEAGTSLIFDIGTPVIGKTAKGVVKLADDAISKVRGLDPRDVRRQKKLLQDIVAGRVVSDLSPEKARSQLRLIEDGQTLLPNQLGDEVASRLDVMYQKIGQTGFLSQGQFKQRTSKINEIVQDEMNKVLDINPLQQGVMSQDVLGENLSEIWKAAKTSLGKEYDASLTEIGNKLSFDKISLQPIRKNIDSWVNRKENLNELGQLTLDEKTLEVVDQLKKFMLGADGTPATSSNARLLIQLEKELNKKINSFSDVRNSGTFNPTVVSELTSLSKRVKAFNRGIIKKRNPEVAKDFIALQKNYGDTITGILPEVNKNFIKKGDRGSFKAIGEMFSSGVKIDNVKALMKQLDTSFDQLSKEEISGLTFKTAEEAKTAIRQSYLTSVLPKEIESIKDFSKYTKIADTLKNNPTETALIKEIMGSKFESFKRTVNLLSDASKNPESGLATLFVRGREFAAVTGTVGGVLAGSALTASGAGAVALAVFGIPEYLAKMATNPRHVNKLIEINALGNKPKKVVRQATILANKVLDDALSEYAKQTDATDGLMKIISDLTSYTGPLSPEQQ
tara:strand:+ start:818 stop:2905 length:2088 start_codon:yes stop_codon:yes gene_type:complete